MNTVVMWSLAPGGRGETTRRLDDSTDEDEET